MYIQNSAWGRRDKTVFRQRELINSIGQVSDRNLLVPVHPVSVMLSLMDWDPVSH